MRVASPLVFVEVDLPVAAQLLARQRLAGGAHGDRPGTFRVAVERLLRQAVPLHVNLIIESCDFLETIWTSCLKGTFASFAIRQV